MLLKYSIVLMYYNIQLIENMQINSTISCDISNNTINDQFNKFSIISIPTI